MHIFGPNELLEDVLHKDLCIGCGACVDLCPYFKNHKGRTAMLFPCTLPQGRCYAYCPKAEVNLTELSLSAWGEPYDGSPLGHHLRVHKARAGEKMVEGPFQAGGTVSALMTYAVKTGMIDAAVLTDRDGLAPVPKLVTQAEEVVLCASSKYVASPTLASVNSGARRGYTRMGVVGTPCQITALAKMRSNPLGREDFADPVALAVGLFCTWALDTRRLIAFLSNRLDISQIKGMDIPPPPAEVLVIDLGNEKAQIPLDEIRPLVPGTCLVCPDLTSEWADVSVGVLEGEPEWNTLIIRTEKGRKLVDEARREGYLRLGEILQTNLDHLKDAAANKKKRALVKAKKEGLLNNTEDGKRSILRMDPDLVENIIA